METYNTSLQARLIPDSEREYYQAIADSYKKLRDEIEKIPDGRWTKTRKIRILALLEDELKSMNLTYRKDYNVELVDIIQIDLKAYQEGKGYVYEAATNIRPELFSIPKTVVKEAIQTDQLMFQYLKANGTKVKNSFDVLSVLQSPASSTFTKVRSMILAGIVSGDTSAKIARDIQPFYTTQQKNSIRTATRTLMANSSQKSHLKWDDENRHIIDRWVYDAVLDTNTSSICRSLDGRTFPEPTEPFIPPVHPNCRSTLQSIPEGYTKTQRPINTMTTADVKKARTLKGAEREAFLQSKIKIVKGDYTFADAVKDNPDLDNKKFIDVDEYARKLGY